MSTSVLYVFIMNFVAQMHLFSVFLSFVTIVFVRSGIISWFSKFEQCNAYLLSDLRAGFSSRMVVREFVHPRFT